MAGYTRQSAGSIVALATITAAPLNAEFNQLQSAFNGTTGHTHSGGAGDGPQINLATGVTGLLPTANLADATLVALASVSPAGIVVQTATDTFAGRTLVAPAAGFTITNSAGAAGDPTFVLANDLGAIEALNTNGMLARTGTDTWAARTLTGPGPGFSISNGNGVAGNPTFALTNDLAALETLAGTGYAVRTGTDTWTNRLISGTANEITVNQGDGVAGNTTISIPTSVTFTGKTVTGGTYSSPTITTPTLTLKQSAAPTPTAEGDIQWDTDDSLIIVGDGAASITFTPKIAATETANSGTAVDFTGIPSWATEIKIVLQGTSTNGSAALRVQLGDSGGIETTGYTGSNSVLAASVTTASATAGFDFGGGSSTSTITGTMIISRAITSATTWVASGTFATYTSSITNWVVNGEKATSATLDRVRLTTTNGTDTFDAGVVTMSYR